MRIRFSAFLPIAGLLLFAAVTYRSMEVNQRGPDGPHKYYWWSSLRLDTDPLNKNPKFTKPCKDGPGKCPEWTPAPEDIVPGRLERVLTASGFPAILAATGLVIELSKHGIDE